MEISQSRNSQILLTSELKHLNTRACQGRWTEDCDVGKSTGQSPVCSLLLCSFCVHSSNNRHVRCALTWVIFQDVPKLVSNDSKNMIWEKCLPQTALISTNLYYKYSRWANLLCVDPQPPFLTLSIFLTVFIHHSNPVMSPSSIAWCVYDKLLQLFPALCNTMDCNLPGSSAHGLLQQEYWSGLSCPSPRDLSNPGIKPTSLISPALADRFFTTIATWEAVL